MHRPTLTRKLLLPTALAALMIAALAGSPAAAATGPHLVKDIVPGTDSAGPSELTDMNGILYFSAKGGGRGRELWRSDGTSTGTRRVKDIRPGGGNGNPWNIAAIGSLLYFSADDGVNGRELWVSDGTSAGTRLVRDINPGAARSEPWGFTEFNGRVYFSAEDAAGGRELWRTDGTAGGTARVKDIVAGSTGSNPGALTVFAGKLVFTATAGSVNAVDTLYRTDGTASGTKPFRDKAGNMITGQGVNWLTIAGTRLFFIVNETELWRSDGTSATTKRIALMNAWELVAVGSRVYFTSGEELWKSDGTAATTTLVRDFVNSGPSAPTALDGKLFFTAHQQPWTSDGTFAGTQAIDAYVQVDSGYARLGSSIYFGGYETEPELATGEASANFSPAPTLTLWRSDGTTAGTYSVGPPDAHMHSPTAVGNSIFFVANEGPYGRELWRYVP